jgi:hypothetical protein
LANDDISATGDGWAVGLRPSASNVTIKDTYIHGFTKHGADRLQYGIFGDLGGDAGVLIQRVNIELADHPVQMERGTLVDSYLHNLSYNDTDHIDAFFSGGGTTDPLVLRHNTIIQDVKTGGLAGDLLFSNAFGVQSNRDVEYNKLGGGNFTIYPGEKAGHANDGSSFPAGTNDVFADNVFTTTVWPNGGQYAPVQDGLTANNSWTNNTWLDGPNAGQAVPTA